MTDEETQFTFFNKALREKNIYQLGMNKGEHVPLSERVLTEEGIEEEKIWGKESRNIKKGKLRVIRTSNVAANVDAIRRIEHGMSCETLTLVEFHGLTKSELGDPIIMAIADILPHTTILCLNLGEIVISNNALKYLLEKIKDVKCILGAIYIETAGHLKQAFQLALADNRKKIEFLYRISDAKRYSYLVKYTSVWWSLGSRPITEWQTRFDKARYKLANETNLLFEDGYYFAIPEEDQKEEEEDVPPSKKKKK